VIAVVENIPIENVSLKTHRITGILLEIAVASFVVKDDVQVIADEDQSI